MKIYYEEKDMVSFGEYLLSKKRTGFITSNHEKDDSATLEERLSQVYHADLENWKHLEQKKPDAPQSFLFRDN